MTTVRRKTGSVRDLSGVIFGDLPTRSLNGTVRLGAMPTAWRVPQAGTSLPEVQVSAPFSPMNPLPPLFDPSMAGRAYDYPIGVNTVVEPRAFSRITFQQLKDMSINSELVRAAIETRKDQMERLNWNIVPRDPKVKNNPLDPRIVEIEQLLRMPDGFHSWTGWLRMLIDQYLVYDAATVYPLISPSSKVLGLKVIDGSTIKRIIDIWGDTPTPGPDLSNPTPAYQQIIKGSPAVNFSRDELIYRPHNVRTDFLYGFGPVEQVFITANMFFQRQQLQSDFFTQGTIPEALLEMPAEWSPSQIAEFQGRWDAMMSNNIAEKRKLKVIPSGAKFTPIKDTVLKDEFDTWLAQIICFAFSLPNSAFNKQVNRATAQTASEQAEDEGLEVMKNWVKELIDFIIVKYWGFTDLVFQFNLDMTTDELKQAQTDQIYLKLGKVGVDELRIRDGQDPIGLGPAVWTSTGVTLVKDFLENGSTQVIVPGQVLEPGTPLGDHDGGEGEGPGNAGDRGTRDQM